MTVRMKVQGLEEEPRLEVLDEEEPRMSPEEFATALGAVIVEEAEGPRPQTPTALLAHLRALAHRWVHTQGPGKRRVRRKGATKRRVDRERVASALGAGGLSTQELTEELSQPHRPTALVALRQELAKQPKGK